MLGYLLKSTLLVYIQYYICLHIYHITFSSNVEIIKIKVLLSGKFSNKVYFLIDQKYIMFLVKKLLYNSIKFQHNKRRKRWEIQFEWFLLEVAATYDIGEEIWY